MTAASNFLRCFSRLTAARRAHRRARRRRRSGFDFAHQPGSLMPVKLRRCMAIGLCVLLAATSTTSAEDLFQSAPGPEAVKPRPRPHPLRKIEPELTPVAPPAAVVSAPQPAPAAPAAGAKCFTFNGKQFCE